MVSFTPSGYFHFPTSITHLRLHHFKALKVHSAMFHVALPRFPQKGLVVG